MALQVIDKLQLGQQPVDGDLQVQRLHIPLGTQHIGLTILGAEHEQQGFAAVAGLGHAEAQRLLSVYVTEHRCHLGIATDGDADRLGVIDEKGNYLHANVLLVILYYYLLKYRGWKGSCVRNVSTTQIYAEIMGKTIVKDLTRIP